jgi:hypothetical protein
LRSATSGGLRAGGHAAIFNERTAIGNVSRNGFYEQVAPGAFKKTLQSPDVILNIDHDPGRILARTSNNTLRLSTDKIGLAVDSDMADVSYAKDLAILLKRQDVKGMSFAFQVDEDDWTTDADGIDLRTLKQVTLFDVCFTAAPAYGQTDAQMRTAVAAARNRKPRLSTMEMRERELAALYGLGAS